MISHRDWLKATAAAGAVLTLDPRDLWALARQEVMTQTIPGTSERIPVVGLGSSATFATVARSEDYSALREVLSALVGNGGTVFDTAPSYGASEEVAGTIAKELGLTDKIFWATKVNVAGRGNAAADPAAAREQIERSFRRIGKQPIDLIQVHNLGDPPTQLGILQEYEAAGRVRYIGMTTTSEAQYGQLMAVVRDHPIDFIGIDYAVDNRQAADEVFPLAQERGIGVLVYAPFGRTRLWTRVAGREVPEWAADFDARTWARPRAGCPRRSSSAAWSSTWRRSPPRMTSALQRFTNVRRDEVPALLASVAFFLCVLTALQVIRPAREALGMRGGLDEVRWLFVGSAVVTLAMNPVFGFLVARFRRMAFIAGTYCFFAASLLAFWGLLTLAPERAGEVSGRVFYVWFSVFNLFSTMIFWALMVDRYTLEQSKRLFGIVAVGGTLGAMLGPWLAWRYAEVIGTANLILVAVGFLILAVAAAAVVVRLRPESQAESARRVGAGSPAPADEKALGGSAWAGLVAVTRSRYLLGIAGFVLVMTVMATFIYFTRLAMVASMTEAVDERTGLFAQIDFWTQFATFLLQLLVTGHVMRRLGVGVALVLLPLTVCLGFVGLAITGTFTALVLLEASYRAMQRGLTRPARETLFTVVGREDKYKSKSVIDTLVYRTGDVLGAWTEGLLGKLGGGVAALTALVIPLAAGWAVLAAWLAREQRRVAAAGPPRRPAAPSPPASSAG